MHEKLITLGKENDTNTRCWRDVIAIMANESLLGGGEVSYKITILCTKEKFVPLHEDVVERFDDKEAWVHRHTQLLDLWSKYKAHE